MTPIVEHEDVDPNLDISGNMSAESGISEQECAGKMSTKLGNSEQGHEAIETRPRRQTPGSNAFVPSVAGLIIAGEVVKDLCRVNP